MDTKNEHKTEGKTAGKSEAKPKTRKVVMTQEEPASNGKTIAIAVLATALGCLVLMFAVLAGTGVISFNGASSGAETGAGTNGTTGTSSTTGDTGSTTADGLIDNPHQRVATKGNLVEVGDLEFYLPKKFEAGGKNSDGAYTYNLVDDDGWAQVLVYAEDSSLAASKFLLEKSPYLDITDTDYEMNGTTWVQGESGSMLAYATKLGGKAYAVIYAVKLDSDTASEAMSMIPKTLYMKRIYQD